MAAKTNKVELYNPGLDSTVEYEINHAERLLRMPNNGGWQLPEGSKFKFTFNNGIEHRRNTETNNGKPEAGDDSESNQSPKPN